MLFAAVPSLELPAQSAPDLPTKKLTSFQEVHRRFTNGTVEIIVTLDPPMRTTTADLQTASARGRLRAHLREVQQAVLDTLPATEVRAGFRFDNIAGFSATVTTNGLRALQAHPAVLAIEPVMEMQPHLAQGIPLLRGMAYRSSYNGQGLAIAICDTGVDYTHPRLGSGGFPNSKVIGGYDFGDNDANPMPNGEAHGTSCAGIAAGSPGTVGDYVGGVAPSAKLYALKISAGTGGSATTAAMAAAWDWCVTHKDDDPANPIMVISTSFGGGRYFSSCDGVSPAMTTAANNAVAAGITVLASSGNNGYCDSLSWPACISSVMSVGAVYDAAFGNYLPCVDAEACAPKNAHSGCPTGWYVNDSTAADKVTAYANVASQLTLFAPAERCYTLDITGSAGYSSGDYYDFFGGTSAACPYAAGAVACLQSAAKAITGNYLTPTAVKDLLATTGDPITDTKVAITKPRVNLERAIATLALSPVSATLIGGNGNQSVDPDECNDLAVAVRNGGSTTVSNLAVTLTTATPGVAILQPNSTFPAIAPGATATNTTPFKISTAPPFLCGTPVILTLAMTHSTGTNIANANLNSGTGNYVLATTSGAAIVPGTTDIGNRGDDVATTISLPFPYTFYGRTFTNATVTANGNLQFGSASTAAGNTCLPASGFVDAILPFWDDLRTDGNIGAAQGIYTSVSGTSPNRVFNVEWRASYYHAGRRGNPVNFQIRLYESQPCFDIVYGVLNGNGSGATVGVQRDNGSVFTQFACNSGVLSNGLQLAFEQVCADGGGPCVIIAAPSITAQPQGRTVNEGTNVTFSLTAGGSTPLSYQWRFNSTPIAGATESTFTFADVQCTNAGNYDVVVTNAGGSLTSSVAVLTVIAPPVISAQPSGQTVIVSQTATFSVTATTGCGGGLTYQWRFNGTDITNATVPSLVLSNIQPADAGDYSVLVSNDAGSITSAVASLVVVVPPHVEFAADMTSGLAPLTVSFTNPSLNATAFAWDFGDGNTSTDVNPANIYSNAGSYTVTLTAIGLGGTNSLTLTNYIVVTNHPPPLADFIADVTNGLSPLTVTFTNLSLNATEFTWDFGDGNTITDASPINTYSNAGNYTVSLTAIGAGGINSLTMTNYILVLNPAQLSVSPIALDFGNVLTGRTAHAALVVSNAGDVPLNGMASVAPGPFALLDAASNAVASLAFDAPALGATNLIVQFAPDQVGLQSNVVVFPSNGGDFTNTVAGMGVGAPLLFALTVDNGNFVFTFDTATGLTYEVQFKDSLADPIWQTLQSVPGDGAQKLITNSVPSPGQRFFRLQVE